MNTGSLSITYVDGSAQWFPFAIMPSADSGSAGFEAVIDEKGRILIPSSYRKAHNIEVGSKVFVSGVWTNENSNNI